MTLPAVHARAFLGAIAIALTAVEFAPLVLGRSIYEVAFLGIHVGATTAIVFLVVGRKARRGPGDGVALADVVCALLALACAVYFASQGLRISERIEGVDEVLPLDYVFGILLIGLLLEACRRIAGVVLMVVAMLFIAYVFLGPYLPGGLSHRGMSLMRFVDLQVLSTQAIFGTPISASAHMVFYFVVVGAFLERSGAGKLFVDLAYCVTGRAWGGAAKASVISSGLFGTVSGSAVANVLVDGIITIPLMKRTGFRGALAGAIEATASTGGQLAPPVMGAAAFILADIVGVSYASVAFAAIVPAALYYLSLYVVVDSHSRRHGLAPNVALPVAESIAGLKERWHILIPLGVMIALLMEGFSLRLVGAASVAAIVVVAFARASTRMNLAAMYEAVVSGSRSAAEVAIPSAVAGIIVGVLVQSGMALHLERWLLDVAGNSLMISLAGAMFLTLIFGMGMPTSAAYLVAAVLVGPALQHLGVPALAAHLFIFYFAVLSMVTPPVALAAYAAAGISGASLWTTGWYAFLIAVPGFMIPFAFVFDQGILLQGEPLHIARVVATAGAGIVGFSAALGGYAFGPLAWPARIALFVLTPLLIDPDPFTDVVGGLGVALLVGWQIWRYKIAPRGRTPAPAAEA
ncbi:MAG: TRAP transporter fused permease subunit [Rhodospirillales bacterium]|nr:TRAP transporter fused permease subunit [Rhodospirillales bacterium]